VVSAPVLARATFGGDVMLQVKPSEASGLRWQGREWTPSEAPEFLAMLRDRAGEEDVGGWVAVHPCAASRLGLPAARRIAAAGFGHVHLGRNEGAENVELYVVYLVPAPGRPAGPARRGEPGQRQLLKRPPIKRPLSVG
jgi:hypothetical protein